MPLGANMAARRSLFAAIGGFRADLGRSSGRLVMGQEVPELLMRARAAGLRGIYLPAMRVHHHIPAKRLTRAYFRQLVVRQRVSRAPRSNGCSRSRSWASTCARRRTSSACRATCTDRRCAICARLRDASLRGRPADAFRHEMMLVFFAGYFWARLTSRPSRAIAG